MREALSVVFIVAFNLVVYWRTLKYGLVMDDMQHWKGRRENGLKGWEYFKSIRSGAQLKQWADERLYSGTTFGLNLRVERSFAIFLNALVAALMYLALGRNEVSLVAALLYSCNPVNNQTSCWLNGRRYILCIVLVLLMAAFPPAAILLYPAAGLLQVTAFFSPVLLVGHSPWYLALIPAALFFTRKWIVDKISSRANAMADGDLKTFGWTRPIVIVKTFGFFFWKMVFPQVCAMQYPDRIKWGQTKEANDEAYALNSSFWIGICAFAVCAAVVFFCPGACRPWAVFMVLATLQWSAIIPVTQILSDRYCSMPNVFVMFFVSYFLHAWAGVFYAPIACVLGAYYLVCLSVVMPMYRDVNSWYSYHFTHFPGLSWYRHCLISDLMNEGKKTEAYGQVVEGLYYDREDFRLLMWAAILSAIHAKPKKAIEFLGLAEKNLCLNKESEQLEEIAYLREQVSKLLVLEKKTAYMTEREKAVFMKSRGVKISG